ncbi:hypothetical protein S40285_07028 [Stachybotrys chlorohalonatus IBT 40285]|uniref:Major facilitator superfamily (MFS) profile domain-containing protein n=1 Tax=Stachybotrys chlorohalonatus (strain IBT 40285) TaxID=1283841 RepID=A0A084QTT0_STAC4|nr:hypothetical protein S40285_07028 [Stachybotrys chlorohalonata IBT 40285]
MYFPLLPLFRQQFQTSAQAINLTPTVYIVFQAISPVISALYVAGNIGLAANQNNYAVLLILRAVQSLGARAAYASSFGVVADVCVSNIFVDIYGYNKRQIGLAHLPRGVGIIIGSYRTGRLMDYNYKATATKHEVRPDKAKGGDMLNFPIERAGSQSSYWMLIVSTGTTVGCGWAVTWSAHPAIPLILQFIQGFWGTYFYTTFSTLLVDTCPECPSTAAAATSVTRCAMAAGGVAILRPPVGRHWARMIFHGAGAVDWSLGFWGCGDVEV